MPQLTPELIAEALASGALDTLADPVARALLDAGPGIDALLGSPDVPPGVSMALDDLVDLACTHGDAALRGAVALRGWHTLGLAVLLRGTRDHVLVTIADSRALARSLADALGLDYASVRIGPYAPHSLAALSASGGDFAKTCAAMRLEAAQALPAGTGGFYGFNEEGAREVLLAQQAMLFVCVKTGSPLDARQMARELHQWACGGPRTSRLGFQLTDGRSVEVDCLPLMAGLPWSLRQRAGYEFQSLLLAELAATWAAAHAPLAMRRYCTLLDLGGAGEVKSVTLLAWFGPRPRVVQAARLSTAVAGELLDVKLTRRLHARGWYCVEADALQDLSCGWLELEGRRVPLEWDGRFAP